MSPLGTRTIRICCTLVMESTTHSVLALDRERPMVLRQTPNSDSTCSLQYSLAAIAARITEPGSKLCITTRPSPKDPVKIDDQPEIAFVGAISASYTSIFKLRGDTDQAWRLDNTTLEAHSILERSGLAQEMGAGSGRADLDFPEEFMEWAAFSSAMRLPG